MAGGLGRLYHDQPTTCWSLVGATFNDRVGGAPGGALTDRFGRRTILVIGLAVSGLVNVGFGPLAAGLVMDNADPRLIWYVGAGLPVAAAAGFWRLAGADDSPPTVRSEHVPGPRRLPRRDPGM